MPEEVKPIGTDGTGYELITNAIKDFLNTYPGLYEGVSIKFEQLEKESGIAFSADSGALVMSEKKTITGKVIHKCQYPFFVIYRTSSQIEAQKLNAQGFLDSIGKWMCREMVDIDGTGYRVRDYPDLSDGRKIERITRMNSYGIEPNGDGVQDWLLPCTVEYTHEYYL